MRQFASAGPPELCELPGRVETIAGAERFLQLRDEWNSLLAESSSDCFFLTWEWLATWWKHLGGGDYELSVLTVRAGDKLVAVAPFTLEAARPAAGRMLPVMTFLGSGFAGSDYLDIIIRRGSEEPALTALADALESCADGKSFSIRLDGLHRTDCAAAKLAARLSDRHWRFDERQTNVCPYIPLEGYTWESYLATLGKETRYNFNRKWKRLSREFTVETETISDSLLLGDALDLLIEQHNARWQERGGSDAFHQKELVTFHHELSQIALASGCLRFYVLRLDGKPAASLYGFLYGGKFYFYQSSLDNAYEKYSVGFLLMGLAIQQSIAEGAREYDLLRGDENYKSHWSSQKRELGRLEIYPPGLKSAAFRSFVQMGRIYRKWNIAC